MLSSAMGWVPVYEWHNISNNKGAYEFLSVPPLP